MAGGLGRGLSSLIPPKVNKVTTTGGDAVVETITVDDRNRIIMVNPSLIATNPEQPRKRFVEQRIDELKDSIKQFGIIQPLIVSKVGDKIELIAGERRLRAARALGLDKVPVIVRNVDELEKLELALIENIQRENLNPIETAMAYKKLIDEFTLSQDDLAKKVGKPRSSIANSLRLLNLPEEIRNALVEGKITEGHAKLIIGLDTEVKQLALYRKIIHDNLPVSATFHETKKMGGTKAARAPLSPEDKSREDIVRSYFQAKAEIKRKGKTGQVIIHFFSEDELGNILSKMR